MNVHLRQVYILLAQALTGVEEEFQKFRETAFNEPPTMEELADHNYVLKNLRALLDAQDKTYTKAEKFFTDMAGRIAENYFTQVEGGGDDKATIRTPWCTATISTKHYHPIPKEDSAEHFELCRWLDIPTDAPMKFRWEGLADVIAERMAKGENPPFDISKMVPITSMTCRGRKDLFTAEEIKHKKADGNQPNTAD